MHKNRSDSKGFKETLATFQPFRKRQQYPPRSPRTKFLTKIGDAVSLLYNSPIKFFFGLATWQIAARIRIHGDKRFLIKSNGFDDQFYRQCNPDVAASRISPLDHYLVHGVDEGRNPNRYFDTRYYLRENPDVRASRINPLVHYLKHGVYEGRKPSHAFEPGDIPLLNSTVTPHHATPAADALRKAESTRFNPQANPTRSAPREGALSKTQLNVLIVIGDFDVGGGQIFAIRLANALVKRFNVFCLNASPHIINNAIPELLDQRVEILPYSGDFQSLANDIRKHEINVVNSHLWSADKLAYRLSTACDLRWFISMHGCYEYFLNNEDADQEFHAIVENMLERTDGVVYPADKNLAVLNKYNIRKTDKYHKIYYGFDRAPFDNLDPVYHDFGDDIFLTGIVSRADPTKGWEIGIAAVIQINESRQPGDKEVHLVLAGDSFYHREYVHNLKAKYASFNFIHFIGYVKQPMSWVKSFDCGLLPTYFESESLPNTIIEYLACRKPSIATAIGEIPNMLSKDGIAAGTLIGLDDAGQPNIDEIVHAIRRYMRQPELLTSHSHNTELLFEQFTMAKCRRAYADVFLNSLAAREVSKVSVVIPLYNHEQYIEAAVQSVLQQSVPADEIIIIDDGSTDDSANIAKRLAVANRQIKFWSRPNQGAHATINEGIENASGDYIAILNSDDIFHPQRIARCLAEIQSPKNIDMVFSHVEFINQQNEILHEKWYHDAIDYYHIAGDLPLSLLRKNFLLTTSNVFAKKSVFDAAGMFRNLRFTHDLDFFMRAILAERHISILEEPLLQYRWHDANTIAESREGLRIEIAANLAFFAMKIWENRTAGRRSIEYFHKINEIACYHQVVRPYLVFLNAAKSIQKIEGADILIADDTVKTHLTNRLIESDSKLEGMLTEQKGSTFSLFDMVAESFAAINKDLGKEHQGDARIAGRPAIIRTAHVPPPHRNADNIQQPRLGDKWCQYVYL